MAILSPADQANRLDRIAWGDLAWARDKLKPFAGRTVHVLVWPFPGFAMRVTPDGHWADAKLDSAEQANVRLRLSAAMMPRLVSAPDKPGSAIDGDGDPALLQALRDLGDVLPLAFEERLSSVIGPLAAHGVVSAMRAATGWPAYAAERVNAGLAAYMTEEAATLVKRSTLEAFAADVDRVRDRVDRLAVTLDRTRSAKPPS